MGTNQDCSSLSRMGGQQEGICPMCMEEMDLTDQELQPCICGYEICLWCWHFIIQTATKDGSDARCPACHKPYDKEKILKRTISKERLEMVNANKKHKLQKNKQRLTNLGIDLNSIRVIRRNIVYIAGIPKSLSDEKTLRKKEYLGQYGKIVKIFFAQTDTSRQYYSSDSCIVYVTFSTEEEALSCIQVVNGYILDGRLLKASFGTTRYCYSWLNNIPCKNSDCLYVHDVVPREDICSREEVIQFCTSKLQQCPGVAFANVKQHSGSSLPPPLGTKNSLQLLGHMTNNRYIQSDDFGRSYASVAASHGQSKPSSGAEAYFPSNAEDHNHVSNAVSSSRNEMPLSLSLAMPLDGICHSENTCSLDCKTATGTNLVAEDNKCRSSFRDDPMSEGIVGEPFFSHSHGNSQLSTSQANVRTHAAATSINSLANISKWKCESLGSVAKNSFSEWDDLGAFSRKCDSFLSLQTLPGNSTSTPQNALPSYDWSRFHSDLDSAKFSYSFEDESRPAPFSKELKDFSTCSTIATNLCHKFDKPSSILPAKPMLIHGEQKKLCSRPSSNSSLDFEFTAIDKTRDEKFLIESYIGQYEDRILSYILTRDHDTIDDLGNKHSILEQLGSSDDFSRISNSSVPSARDASKSYFSMEDFCGAIEQLSPWSNSASDLTKNSSCSEMMAEEQAYMKDSFNKSYLETSKTSKVLNNTSLVSDTVLVSEFGSSSGMHHSGSLSRPISQHPYSNSILRTTLSTPPGFPPRKTNPAAGIAPESHQPHNSFSARCFSNTKATSSSHSNFAENTSPAIFNRGEEQNLLKSSTPSDSTSRKNSQHLFFQSISNHQESSKDRFDPVSSNASDFVVTGRNKPTLNPISRVVPELQDRHLPSYF
ncbi:uncharacterized protein LOC110116538 isoform X1 [Dendrobium catenatum]|uniref:uncharacterized protein LOC110116538 isoform X1 n=2 Tax=Dendrobium catenatum TaxID=906689 RepID=UPI0009F3AD40|nr:uncharacterized protein LOC110116538 isoform X1 [Dendrobium catenatum]